VIAGWRRRRGELREEREARDPAHEDADVKAERVHPRRLRRRSPSRPSSFRGASIEAGNEMGLNEEAVCENTAAGGRGGSETAGRASRSVRMGVGSATKVGSTISASTDAESSSSSSAPS